AKGRSRKRRREETGSYPEGQESVRGRLRRRFTTRRRVNEKIKKRNHRDGRISGARAIDIHVRADPSPSMALVRDASTLSTFPPFHFFSPSRRLVVKFF